MIQAKRRSLNGQISAGLSSPEAAQSVDGQPILASLAEKYDSMHPIEQAQERAAIEDVADRFQQHLDQNGQIPLSDLHAFKMGSQVRAEPAYGPAGVIFPEGPSVAQANKTAAAAARDVLIAKGPQQIADAETQLANLHDIQDTMNKNLIKPDSAYHVLSRAGTNPGGIEARTLDKLTDATGTDFNQDAKDFATVQLFKKAPILPQESTGKSLTRMVTGGSIGGLIAKGIGMDPAHGAELGAALVSPLALKTGINTFNSAGNIAGGAANMAAKAAPVAVPAAVQALIPRYGLMAQPPTQPQQPPNFSTIPGRNGH